MLDKYPLAVRPFYTMPDPFDVVSLVCVVDMSDRVWCVVNDLFIRS